MKPHAIALIQAAGPTNEYATALPAVLTVAILLLILALRIRGRELRPGKVLVLPLIVVGLGLASTVPQLSTARLHAIDAAVIAADLLISLVLGGIRGFTVLIYPRNGTTWYRYGPLTVALWLLSITLRVVLGVVAAPLGANALITTGSTLFMLGLTLLTQNVILIGRRQRRVGGATAPPNAPAHSGARS